MRTPEDRSIHRHALSISFFRSVVSTDQSNVLSAFVRVSSDSESSAEEVMICSCCGKGFCKSCMQHLYLASPAHDLQVLVLSAPGYRQLSKCMHGCMHAYLCMINPSIDVPSPPSPASPFQGDLGRISQVVLTLFAFSDISLHQCMCSF